MKFLVVHNWTVSNGVVIDFTDKCFDVPLTVSITVQHNFYHTKRIQVIILYDKSVYGVFASLKDRSGTELIATKSPAKFNVLRIVG
jgi:hypothetical protein